MKPFDRQQASPAAPSSSDDGSTIAPIAIPGIHERFLPWFRARTAEAEPGDLRVLDVGAGRGAMSQRLHRAGYAVEACDKFPDAFEYGPVTCHEADFSAGLPMADASYDIALAMEVTEHIHDHGLFFSECARVLRPGGRLFVTTPNILSLKSRWRFMTTGYPYTFGPLEQDRHDGLQHVAALSLDQYRYLGRSSGLALTAVATDMRQHTSVAMLPFWWPMLWLWSRRHRIPRGDAHNRLKLLLGRILFLEFTREAGD